MTAKEWPLGASVQVRGACNAPPPDPDNVGAHINAGFSDDDATVLANATHLPPWYEESLTWDDAPFVPEGDDERVLCDWAANDEDIYLDGLSSGDGDGGEYDGGGAPFECDITALAASHARGHLCLSLDMVHRKENPRDPVKFWSREALVDAAQPSSSGAFLSAGASRPAVDPQGATRFPQLQSQHEQRQQQQPPPLPLEYERERTPQPLQARSDGRAQRADDHSGDASTNEPAGAGAGNSGFLGGGVGWSTTGYRRRENRVAGLEFGTVQLREGGHGRGERGGDGAAPLSQMLLRDAGRSWRPHLVIEGSHRNCGRFADHIATLGCDS